VDERGDEGLRRGGRSGAGRAARTRARCRRTRPHGDDRRRAHRRIRRECFKKCAARGSGGTMTAWQDDWRRVRTIAWKDLTTERRSKAGFNGVVALGVTILVLFGFALGPDAQAIRDAAAGAVWLAVLFAGVLAFNRSYQVELETGALEQLL